jgi:hypothetical protein
LVICLFWVVSDFVFGFLCILFVYLEACLRFPWMGGLGFLCMFEAFWVVFVYLKAFGAFFLSYNTLTYQNIYIYIYIYIYIFTAQLSGIGMPCWC